MSPTPLSLGLQTVPPVPKSVPLCVTGTLPSFLETSNLYRIGPGRYEAPHGDRSLYNVRHWFDGFSTLHAFNIQSAANSVSYQSIPLCESILRAIAQASKSSYQSITFGRGDPCRSLLSKFFHLWTKEPIDPTTQRPHETNINVTVQRVPGKGICARTDTNSNVAIDTDNFEIDHFFGFNEIDPVLSGQMSAAHGHYDEETGEFFNFVYAFGGGASVQYRVFRIDKSGSATVLGTFHERACYLHSFATTKKYIILCVWPAEINGLGVMFNKSVMDAMHFEKGKETKFYVISRSGEGLVATYSAEAFFCFHTVNAFDTDDGIAIDVCRYDDAEVLDQFMLEYMRKESKFAKTTLTRYELEDLSAAAVDGAKTPHAAKKRVLNEDALELPRTNPKVLREDYTFAYGVSCRDGLFDEIAKVNVKTGARVSWSMGNCVTGEPIFVGDPNGSEEDDGCLLVVVLDGEAKRSCLVVLDAKTMTQVARASMEQVVPLGFHGLFNRV